MTTRAEVCAAARKRLGVQWTHQGRGAHGLDCAGVLIETAREFMAVPDIANYPRVPDGVTLRRVAAEYLRPIGPSKIKPGDVVVLRFPGAPHESHLAWVVDHPRGLGLLHGLNRADGKGVVIEHGLDPAWQRRITAAFRLPIFED